MGVIRLQEAKYGGKCVCCEERWRKFEKFYNVVGERGENYCTGCLEYAKLNNPGFELEDSTPACEAEDTPPGLVRVKGDHRLFARTRHGLRAGYEHTGHRCEDAPCCGCCD